MGDKSISVSICKILSFVAGTFYERNIQGVGNITQPDPDVSSKTPAGGEF